MILFIYGCKDSEKKHKQSKLSMLDMVKKYYIIFIYE